MHPALRLENLSRLPAAYRVSQISACLASILRLPCVEDGDCCHQIVSRDIQNFYHLLKDLPKGESRPLLPVVYLHLEPLSIPALDTMDAMINNDTISAVNSALYALIVIARIARLDSVRSYPGRGLAPCLELDSVLLALW